MKSQEPNYDRDTRETFVAEGIYSVDPTDPGGETFRGISRKYHPEFPGWPDIDRIKSTTPAGAENVAAALRHHRELEHMALDFYEAHFWNPLRLDEVIDGRIAAELFDQAVNLGRSTAVRHLQVCLNALNRNGELYVDLVEDGEIGEKTLGALRAYLEREAFYEEAVHVLLVMLNTCQGWHYLEAMRKSPTKEKYARGFFKRVCITKERD